MTKLVFDNVGERYYETGVKNGVLFVQESNGTYKNGVAWNGITQAQENPTGAEVSDHYADDIKYLSIQGVEKFEGSISAFYSPKEFDECDGGAEIAEGVSIHEQSRKSFGFAFLSTVGNDTDGIDKGQKLHIWYGCRATPSERSYATIGENPEPSNPSWSVKGTPVSVTGKRPTSRLTIDSTRIEKAKWDKIIDYVYGSESADSKLPLPDEVLAIIA